MEVMVEVVGRSALDIVEFAEDANVGAFYTAVAETCGLAADSFSLLWKGETLADMATPMSSVGAQAGDTFTADMKQTDRIAYPRVLQRRERFTMALRTEVRKKPLWFTKIMDESIRKKWVTEAMEARDVGPVLDYGEESFLPYDKNAACKDTLAALASEAALITAGKPLISPEPDYMRHQDGMIPPALANTLNKLLAPFREAKDWHPGSNDQVLDLIHPSLYCLVKDSEKPTKKRRKHLVSSTLDGRPSSEYAWIPTDFKVGADGTVAPEGYINNIPVEATELTEVVCDVLSRFLPLLSAVRSITDSDTFSESELSEQELTDADKQELNDVLEHLDSKYMKEGADEAGIIFDNGDVRSVYHKKAAKIEDIDSAAFRAVLTHLDDGEPDKITRSEVIEVAGRLDLTVPGGDAMDEDEGEDDDDDDDDDDDEAEEEEEEETDAKPTSTKPVLTCPFELAFKGDLDALKRSPGVHSGTVNNLHKDRGTSLLYTAARFGHMPVVQWLVQKLSAFVNIANSEAGSASTPLHGAAYGGHAAIAALLMKHGADKSAKNKHGDTPLEDAGNPASGVSKAAQKKVKKAITDAKKRRIARAKPDRTLAEKEAKASPGTVDSAGLDLIIEIAKHNTKKGTKTTAKEIALKLFAHVTEDLGHKEWCHVSSLEDAIKARKRHEHSDHQRELKQRLKLGKKFQVIVKAADIVLTPENPVYPGGTWHLEGSREERIVATGIYYYDQDNVTPSHLCFRKLVDAEDMEYEQCQHDHIYTEYRVEPNDMTNMILGEVSTPTGRCIAFPNDLQHKAAPFQLVDHTKPGFRKMLVFFVVSPEERIPSTSDIPRQQDFVTLEQALRNRLELMEDRKGYTAGVNSEWEEEVSLCEH